MPEIGDPFPHEHNPKQILLLLPGINYANARTVPTTPHGKRPPGKI